jgi:hypothetical protein
MRNISLILLTPGFSRVPEARSMHQPFQWLYIAEKPFKRFRLFAQVAPD